MNVKDIVGYKKKNKINKEVILNLQNQGKQSLQSRNRQYLIQKNKKEIDFTQELSAQEQNSNKLNKQKSRYQQVQSTKHGMQEGEDEMLRLLSQKFSDGIDSKLKKIFMNNKFQTQNLNMNINIHYNSNPPQNLIKETHQNINRNIKKNNNTKLSSSFNQHQSILHSQYNKNLNQTIPSKEHHQSSTLQLPIRYELKQYHNQLSKDKKRKSFTKDQNSFLKQKLQQKQRYSSAPYEQIYLQKSFNKDRNMKFLKNNKSNSLNLTNKNFNSLNLRSNNNVIQKLSTQKLNSLQQDNYHPLSFKNTKDFVTVKSKKQVRYNSLDSNQLKFKTIKSENDYGTQFLANRNKFRYSSNTDQFIGLHKEKSVTKQPQERYKGQKQRAQYQFINTSKPRRILTQEASKQDRRKLYQSIGESEHKGKGSSYQLKLRNIKNQPKENVSFENSSPILNYLNNLILKGAQNLAELIKTKNSVPSGQEFSEKQNKNKNSSDRNINQRFDSLISAKEIQIYLQGLEKFLLQRLKSIVQSSGNSSSCHLNKSKGSFGQEFLQIVQQIQRLIEIKRNQSQQISSSIFIELYAVLIQKPLLPYKEIQEYKMDQNEQSLKIEMMEMIEMILCFRVVILLDEKDGSKKPLREVIGLGLNMFDLFQKERKERRCKKNECSVSSKHLMGVGDQNGEGQDKLRFLAVVFLSSGLQFFNQQINDSIQVGSKLSSQQLSISLQLADRYKPFSDTKRTNLHLQSQHFTNLINYLHGENNKNVKESSLLSDLFSILFEMTKEMVNELFTLSEKSHKCKNPSIYEKERICVIKLKSCQRILETLLQFKTKHILPLQNTSHKNKTETFNKRGMENFNYAQKIQGSVGSEVMNFICQGVEIRLKLIKLILSREFLKLTTLDQSQQNPQQNSLISSTIQNYLHSFQTFNRDIEYYQQQFLLLDKAQQPGLINQERCQKLSKMKHQSKDFFNMKSKQIFSMKSKQLFSTNDNDLLKAKNNFSFLLSSSIDHLVKTPQIQSLILLHVINFKKLLLPQNIQNQIQSDHFYAKNLNSLSNGERTLLQSYSLYLKGQYHKSQMLIEQGLGRTQKPYLLKLLCLDLLIKVKQKSFYDAQRQIQRFPYYGIFLEQTTQVKSNIKTQYNAKGEGEIKEQKGQKDNMKKMELQELRCFQRFCSGVVFIMKKKLQEGLQCLKQTLKLIQYQQTLPNTSLQLVPSFLPYLNSIIQLYLAYVYYCLNNLELAQEALQRQKLLLQSSQKDTQSQSFHKTVQYNHLLCRGLKQLKNHQYQQALNSLTQCIEIINRPQPHVYISLLYYKMWRSSNVSKRDNFLSEESHISSRENAQILHFTRIDKNFHINLQKQHNNQDLSPQIKQSYLQELYVHLCIACNLVSEMNNNFSSEIFYFRSLYYSWKNHWDLALKDIDEAIDKSEQNYSKHFYLRALILACSENYQQAISEASLAISLNDKCHESYLLRSKCCQIEGDQNQAFLDLQTYIAIKHDDTQIHKYAGHLLFQNGAFEDAIMAYQEGQSRNLNKGNLDGQEFHVFLTKSKAHFLLGQFELAAEDMKTACEIRSEEREYYFDYQMIRWLGEVTEVFSQWVKDKSNYILGIENSRDGKLKEILLRKMKELDVIYELIDCDQFKQGEMLEGKIFKKVEYHLFKFIIHFYTEKYLQAIEQLEICIAAKQASFRNQNDNKLGDNKLEFEEEDNEKQLFIQQMHYNLCLVNIKLGKYSQAKIQLLKCQPPKTTKGYLEWKHLISHLEQKQPFCRQTQYSQMEKIQVFSDKNKLSKFFPELQFQITPSTITPIHKMIKICIPYPKVEPPQIYPKFDLTLLDRFTQDQIYKKPQPPWITNQKNSIKFTEKITTFSRLDIDHSENGSKLKKYLGYSNNKSQSQIDRQSDCLSQFSEEKGLIRKRSSRLSKKCKGNSDRNKSFCFSSLSSINERRKIHELLKLDESVQMKIKKMAF